jgi:hypothetical protein
MKSSGHRNRPRFITLLALFFGGVVTLATSEAPAGFGSSGESVIWNGERQLLEVQIAPVEDRLAPFDYNGDHHLALVMPRIAVDELSSVRWSLQMPLADGEPFSSDGGFVDIENQREADDGLRYGTVRVVLGRFCTDGELAADGCLPCRLSVGCTFSLALDRCHPPPVGEGDSSAELVIQRDSGASFVNRCMVASEMNRCDKLDSWISLETRPLEPGLCDP